MESTLGSAASKLQEAATAAVQGEHTRETGDITGTPDKDYNLLWFAEQCMSNTLRMQVYAQDAEREGDHELADFFRRAQAESKKGAEQAKVHLKRRL
ncbi:MAG: hypothetical protein J2O48_14045 [Solirubrobacterales bacterium]|nr:hypothetical protein [Solirubrobacterales bacterium]